MNSRTDFVIAVNRKEVIVYTFYDDLIKFSDDVDLPGHMIIFYGLQNC